MGTITYAAKIGKHDVETLEHKLSEKDLFLFDAARGIDKIDPYVGIGSFLLYNTDDNLSISVGLLANVTEALLFKAPFITTYYKQTKDWKGTMLLTAKTALITFNTNLAYLQLLPTNYWVMQRYLKRKYEKKK